MEFELTPEITDEIIFSMEDQAGIFLFDTCETRCVSSDAATQPNGETERYYAIPQWDSVSGFRMMDRFAAQLRNPVVREDLRVALSSGQGVFRKFKNILKEYPEVERLWFTYKEREMRSIVREWYNNLRDFWGLERIGEEPEETEELVREDFTFRIIHGPVDTAISELIEDAEQELLMDLPLGLHDALSLVISRLRPEISGMVTIVVDDMEGLSVGAARSGPLPSDSLHSAALETIAVLPEFRGLGLGKELASRTVRYWQERLYRHLVCAAPVIPQPFYTVLRRLGFENLGHLSVLNFTQRRDH